MTTPCQKIYHIVTSIEIRHYVTSLNNDQNIVPKKLRKSHSRQPSSRHQLLSQQVACRSSVSKSPAGCQQVVIQRVASGSSPCVSSSGRQPASRHPAYRHRIVSQQVAIIYQDSLQPTLQHRQQCQFPIVGCSINISLVYCINSWHIFVTFCSLRNPSKR